MEELAEKYFYLFPIAFAALWFALLSVLSRLSGWKRASELYSGDGAVVGPKRSFQSISMGYGTFMDVGFRLTPSAVRISLLFLFRPFHPPLVIPFSELTAEPRTLLFIFRMIELTPQRAPAIKIKIPQSLAKWIEKESGGNWSFPRENSLSQV